MTGDEKDTIAAPATAPGRSAIGVIRMSGPQAISIASRLFSGSTDPNEAAGHTALHGYFEYQGEKLDQVLLLVMRAPRSYTGEDMAEFHCHGGHAVMGAVLDAVLKEGARPAAPGEFTRRAFLNGKIDLARAEAVADLVSSETETAARMALANLEGGLSRKLENIRERLAYVLAMVEAGIDFSDEEDVVPMDNTELAERTASLAGEIREMAEGAAAAKKIFEGVRVVVAGRPNVGKSTLVNRLLGSDRVIVTDTPGTTRDAVECRLDISGVPVSLFDTAGLRETGEEAEKLGVTRTRELIETAALTLFMVDGSAGITEEDRKEAGAVTSPSIVAINKIDLGTVISRDEAAALAKGARAVEISAREGAGIEELLALITDAVITWGPEATGGVTSHRQEEALLRGASHLGRAREAAREGLSPEFIASDLRLCLDAIGEITGETATDDILDIVFSRFCIGK